MTAVSVYAGEKNAKCDLRLVPGDNLYIGSQAVKRTLGGLTSLEEDLLRIAGSVYATDLGVKRSHLACISRTIEQCRSG